MVYLDFAPPQEHDVCHHDRVTFAIETRSPPRVVVRLRPCGLEGIDAASYVCDESICRSVRAIFDRRDTTGKSPFVLLTDFTSRRTLQQVRMTIRIPCKVSEHMAPRPPFEQ